MSDSISDTRYKRFLVAIYATHMSIAPPAEMEAQHIGRPVFELLLKPRGLLIK